MKASLARRPAFFTFLSNLRVSVIQDGVTRVMQADAGYGPEEPAHLTKHEKRFTEAGKDVTAQYKTDKISAQQMLEKISDAYENKKIFQAFDAQQTRHRTRAELEAEANFEPQAPEPDVDDPTAEAEDGTANDDPTSEAGDGTVNETEAAPVAATGDDLSFAIE